MKLVMILDKNCARRVFPAVVILRARVLDVAKLVRPSQPTKVVREGALLFSRHTRVRHTQVVHDCDDHHNTL